MNKDSIYRLIGYNGVYSTSVKKVLKKLLRENHPDHNGDKEIFKLINEVKKELENNHVSYKVDKKIEINESIEDIDYTFCHEMIKKLELERQEIKKELEKKNSDIEISNDDYKKFYNKSMKIEDNMLNIKEIKKYNFILELLFIVSIIVITITIIVNTTILKIISCLLIVILVIFKSYGKKRNSKYLEDKNKELNNYKRLNKNIIDVVEKRKKMSNDTLNLERKLKRIENDLRFYNNLLK